MNIYLTFLKLKFPKYKQKSCEINSHSFYFYIGASDRSRTCTPKALDPKSSASASSATLA